MYGVLAGGYNALVPTTVAELYGTRHYSSVNSTLYFIRGLGALVGAPLAGVILGSHQRGIGGGPSMDIQALKRKYTHVAVYDGVVWMGAFACVAYVRWSDAKYRKRWLWKA